MLTPLTPQDTMVATLGDPSETMAEVAQPEPGFERAMLSQDKLYVVLAVVLLIWLGVLVMLFRTDRKLARLEDQVRAHVPEDDTF